MIRVLSEKVESEKFPSVCVCVRERAREREKGRGTELVQPCLPKRGEASAASPRPPGGVRRAGQDRVPLEARSTSIFRVRLLLKDGSHDHVQTSHRLVFKAEMLTPQPGSLLLTRPWKVYGELRS